MNSELITDEQLTTEELQMIIDYLHDEISHNDLEWEKEVKLLDEIDRLCEIIKNRPDGEFAPAECQ